MIDDAVDGLNAAYAAYSDPQQPGHSIAALFKALESAIEVLKNKGVKEQNEHTLLRKYIVKNSRNFMEIVAPFVDKIPRNQLTFVAKKVLD